MLQRDAPIRLWGDAAPGTRVTVQLESAQVQARADRQGHWEARLPAHAAGGPYSLKASAADGVVQQIDDVLIGDVWLCSGQSNMELQVHRTLDSRSEIADADHPTIRMFKVPAQSSPTPQRGFGGAATWQRTTPETVKDFSAACYYFARELQKCRCADGLDQRLMGRFATAGLDRRQGVACSRRQWPCTGCAGALRNRPGGCRAALGRAVGNLVACAWRRRTVAAGCTWPLAECAAGTGRVGRLGRAAIGRLQRHGLVPHQRRTDPGTGRTRRHIVTGAGGRAGPDLGQRARRGQQLWRRSTTSLRATARTAACRAQQHRAQCAQYLSAWRLAGRCAIARTAVRRWQHAGAGCALALPHRVADSRHATACAVVVGCRVDHVVQRHDRAAGAAGLRGALWYQGESNTGDAVHYPPYSAHGSATGGNASARSFRCW